MEPGKLTETDADPPPEMEPSDNGRPEPLVAPRVAVVSVTFAAVPLPVFFTVTSTELARAGVPTDRSGFTVNWIVPTTIVCVAVAGL